MTTAWGLYGQSLYDLAAEEKADDQAETHGERRDFKRQARALEKQGKAVDDQG